MGANDIGVLVEADNIAGIDEVTGDIIRSFMLPATRQKVIPIQPYTLPTAPKKTEPTLPMVACLYKYGAEYDLRRSMGTQEQANECKGQCDYASKSCYTPFDIPRSPNIAYINPLDPF